MTETATYQSRFVEYARAHGREPLAQIEHDRESWPGGIMAGFQLWIGDRWSEFRKANGCPFDCTKDHHEAFDLWLSERATGADA